MTGKGDGVIVLVTRERGGTTSCDLKILPCAVNNPPVRVLAFAFLQGLQTSLNHCARHINTQREAISIATSIAKM